ncbi:MAG: SDR family oxidoreductase [Candidatus Glassbacteria bacterium]
MGKAALVTGGARRIGRAIALALSRTGYDIALHYSSSAVEAQSTAEQIRAQGTACETFRCDLERPDQLLALVDRVVEKMPGLELLVNNASVFRRGSIAETDPLLFDSHLAVNLRAPFFLTREFAARCGRGQVINLLDSRIDRDDFAYAAYTITKKALAALTRIAAREFGPAIRVNAVAPGPVLPPAGESQAAFLRIAGGVPLARPGSPELVARSVLYLLENDYLTGQVIYVDGGDHLK